MELQSNLDLLPANLTKMALNLLLFDSATGPIVRDLVPISCWIGDPNLYSFVQAVYNYIGLYKTVPADHSYDILVDLPLKEANKEALCLVVEECEETKGKCNTEYILNSLQKFYKQAVLKQTIYKGLELLDQGKLDELENNMQEALKSNLQTLDKGSNLLDIANRIGFKDEAEDHNYVKLGIPAFDDLLLIPKRKQLWMVVAPLKGGKSWGLIHAGRQAILAGLKVLHISLEMDEDQVGERYIQSLFRLQLDGNTKRKQDLLKFAEPKRLDWYTPAPSGALSDKQEQERVIERLTKQEYLSKNLIIKQFATSSLSINALKAYLNALELQHNFIPDLLIVDYADLLKRPNATDSSHHRIEVGNLYKELRGIAVERNIMVATASQANREGSKGDKVEAVHVAEDYSKLATADTAISLVRKDNERDLGICRAYVMAARAAQDKFEVLITQDLNLGQFVLTSERLTPDINSNLSTYVSVFTNG